MKIRNGFVSNSSSSSFIIAYKACEKCPTCGRKDFDIVDLIKSKGVYGENSVSAEGQKAVIKEMKDWFGEEGGNDVIAEVKKAEKDGYKTAMLSISYHDETLNDLFESAENIEILYGDMLK